MRPMMEIKSMSDTPPAPPRRGIVGRIWHYVVHEPNPLVQIIYINLMVGCKYIFVRDVYPFIPNAYIAEYHRWFAAFIWIVCVGLYIYMCFRDPGVITPANVKSVAKYPHHPVLYPEAKYCRTCKTLKVPRSKHCRLCNHCVARFDHHCIWFNSCVGANNYKPFILFLLIQLVTAIEGFYVCSSVFMLQTDAIIASMPASSEDDPDRFRHALQSVIKRNQPLGFVTAMSLMISLVLWIFLLMQLRRITGNMTANESFKRDDLRELADPDSVAGAKKLFNMLFAGLPGSKKPRKAQKAQPKDLDSSWGGLFSPDSILNTEETFTVADVDFNPYNLGSFWRNLSDAFQWEQSGAATHKKTN